MLIKPTVTKISRTCLVGIPFLAFLIFSVSGCAVLKAGGDTIEALGEGASTALVGLASGTGHAIAGTGRAISNAAANTTPQSITGYSDQVEKDERLVF